MFHHKNATNFGRAHFHCEFGMTWLKATRIQPKQFSHSLDELTALLHIKLGGE